MEVIGHVAGREDAGNVGAAACIDQDSVPYRHTGGFDDFDIRFDPDSHDREVAGNPPTLSGDDSLDPQRPLESHRLILCYQLDPGLAVYGAEHAGHFGHQDCVERGTPTH